MRTTRGYEWSYDLVTRSLTARVRRQVDPRVMRRAKLTPEERVVGSACPERQAQAILADSDTRCRAARDGSRERRRSEDTVWVGG